MKVILIILAILIYIFLIPPIQQNLAYHNFADNRTVIIGLDTIGAITIANFCNVMSNIVFIVVGIDYMYRNLNQWKHGVKWLYPIGIILTGIGSAYYHYNPNNETLIWDRLPMSILFMYLLSVFLKQEISTTSYQRYSVLINPITLMTVGVLSIIWWAIYDNLKLYILVQFGPLIYICYSLYKYHMPLSFTLKNIEGRRALKQSIALYAIAKICEILDENIFNFTFTKVSGHTLKHMFASMACYYTGIYIDSVG